MTEGIYDFRFAICDLIPRRGRKARGADNGGQLSFIHAREAGNSKRKSQIANRKSQIANRKSQIANRKSQIANLKSKI